MSHTDTRGVQTTGTPTTGEKPGSHGRDVLTKVLGTVDEDWPLLVGLPTVAIILRFVVPSLGWWALGVAALIFGAGSLAYRYHSDLEATQDGLIRTLGRLPEIDGVVAPGHSGRSAALAGRIATEMGIRPDQRRAIVEAARCHDVGKVGRDPDPEARPGFDTGVAERWSGLIVRTMSWRDDLAELVGPVPQDAGADLLVRRAIVDVAAAYDDATSTMGLSPADAVAVISHGFGTEAVPAIRSLGRLTGVTVAIA